MTANRILAGGLFLIASLAPIDTLHAQGVPVWQLIEDIQVGADHEFTRILAILPLADGSSIIGDNGNQEIAVFDARGRYSRSVGGAGRGPGEFLRLSALGLLGDTIWAIDRGERRTSHYSSEGEVLASIRMESGAFLSAMLSNGAAAGLTSAGFGSGTEFRDSVLPVLLTSRAGSITDTLAWLPYRNEMLALPNGGGFTIARQHFSDAGLVLYAPMSDAFFVVDRSVAARRNGATFTVAAFDAGGDTLWQRSYPYLPKPVERRQADSLYDATKLRLRRSGHTREAIRDALFVPEFHPPITAGFAASNGWIWLRREEGSDSTRYLIIDGSGNPVATTVVPTAVTLMAASESMAWGVRKDEYDVPSVIRYRIQR